MARAHRALLYASLAVGLYFLIFFQFVALPWVHTKIVEQLLPVIPWWLLVSFGSYSLWSLGWGLYTFKDCPEAYTDLLHEISEAKNDLRAKGVTVD